MPLKSTQINTWIHGVMVSTLDFGYEGAAFKYHRAHLKLNEILLGVETDHYLFEFMNEIGRGLA